MGGEAQHRESPNKWKWGDFANHSRHRPDNGKSALRNARLVRRSLMGAYSTQKNVTGGGFFK
jgi:hypothetical protein